VFITIDTSFAPRADAFVPLLDEEFLIDIDLGRVEAPNVANLRKGTEKLTQRSAELRERAGRLNHDVVRVEGLIEAFADGPLLAEVHRLSGAAEHDRDAPATWQKKLREAETALDEIEKALEFPELVDEGRRMAESVRQMVDEAGTRPQQGALHDTEQAMETAIADGNRMLLQRQMNRIGSIARDVLRDTGRLDAVMFSALENGLSDSPDPQVQRLLQEGRSALARGEIARLRGIVDKLRQVAPGGTADMVTDDDSTVMLGDR
jgi:molecular chaperone DnaK